MSTILQKYKHKGYINFPFQSLRNFETKIVFFSIEIYNMSNFHGNVWVHLINSNQKSRMFRLNRSLMCNDNESPTNYILNTQFVYLISIILTINFDHSCVRWWMNSSKTFSREKKFYAFSLCSLHKPNDVRSLTHNHHSSN